MDLTPIGYDTMGAPLYQHQAPWPTDPASGVELMEDMIAALAPGQAMPPVIVIDFD